MDTEHRTCLNCRKPIEWRPGEPRRDFERRIYCDRKCWSEGKRRDWKSRFWSKVERRSEGECWPWTACIGDNGYGYFMKDGRGRKAHAVIAEEVHGPGRPGQEVLHKCGRRSCVNPAHLEWGTRTENMRDMVLHGTSRAKLTPKEVREIRQLLGRVGHRQIGEWYGVSTAAIDDISKGKSWGWLR